MNYKNFEEYQTVTKIAYFNDNKQALFEIEKARPYFEFIDHMEEKYKISKQGVLNALDMFMDKTRKELNSVGDKATKKYENEIKEIILEYEANPDKFPFGPNLSDIEAKMKNEIGKIVKKKLYNFADFHKYPYPDLLADSWYLSSKDSFQVHSTVINMED